MGWSWLSTAASRPSEIGGSRWVPHALIEALIVRLRGPTIQSTQATLPPQSSVLPTPDLQVDCSPRKSQLHRISSHLPSTATAVTEDDNATLRLDWLLRILLICAWKK